MKYIYIYRKNDYAALLAAYLRLKNKTISTNQIKFGILFLGIDEELNEVYIVKYRRNPQVLINLLKGIGEIYREELKIIDLGKYDRIYFRTFKNRVKRNLLKDRFKYENLL
ncbi:DUF3189 family protein [Alkaliphilus serpentinus]|uniref:DUF3189 family protein n=1 Tax=Alkaliphilus serpentinus TaxID=1482731 RepID=A0A833HRB6_9FIRM|nr:DUF3189 family protein [Alkaliphilus serpentinus]KAB3533168.1 DUF3189 family protein [Alkaliphilus serpentinus]